MTASKTVPTLLGTALMALSGCIMPQAKAQTIYTFPSDLTLPSNGALRLGVGGVEPIEGAALDFLDTIKDSGSVSATQINDFLNEVRSTPLKHDVLLVGGRLTRNGLLEVFRKNKFQLQVGDRVILIAAARGFAGQFNKIDNEFETGTAVVGELVTKQYTYSRQFSVLVGSDLVTRTVSETANVLVLEGTQGSFTDALGKGADPNCVTVAKQLNEVANDPRAEELISAVNTVQAGQLCEAFDLIAPTASSSAFSTGDALSDVHASNVTQRMANVRGGSIGFNATGFGLATSGLAGDAGSEGKSGKTAVPAAPDRRWGVFITGFGELTDVEDTAGAPGYDLTTGGVTLGADYRVTDNLVIGVTAGYSNTDGDTGNGGSLDVNGGKIGLYATVFTGGFYVDGAVNAGLNSYDSSRAGFGGKANSDTDGYDLNFVVATGYDWKVGGFSVGPVVSYEYTHVSLDGFEEHGSLAPLALDRQDSDTSSLALGLKASYEWKLGSVLLKPEVSVSWQHQLGDQSFAVVSRFANGAGGKFSVQGADLGEDGVLVGAGVAAQLNDRTTVFASYDGDLGRENFESHTLTGGLRVAF